MLFTYKARDSAGAPVTGEMYSRTADEVKSSLADQGFFPTSVEKKGMAISLPMFLGNRSKAKIRDLIDVTRQFYALFKAGVNMDRLLLILSKQTMNIGLQSAFVQIREDIGKGANLFTAFSKHPKFFNELYVNMLNVGEHGGILEATLARLSDILRKEHKLITSVKSATLYPKLVLLAFFAVLTLMLVFVIPRFADFYAGYDAKLPLPTRILIGASDVVSAYWYIVLALVAVLFVAFRKYASTPSGAKFLDKLKLKMPVFGRLNLLVMNARFGHLVSALYKSGLPIASTFEIVGRTIGNKEFQREILSVNNEVARGASLALAMEGKKYFTALMAESVAVGEQTGSLDEMMETTAQFYDEEVDIMLSQLTTLIEPLLLFGIFGMVALLALAIFLPWWNIARLVLKGG